MLLINPCETFLNLEEAEEEELNAEEVDIICVSVV